MLESLKTEANYTWTENGALTYASTTNHCLDLFATIGALRHAKDCEIVTRFLRAYAEDADLAMKCLFYGRDIREGLGERRAFRTILNWLAYNHRESVEKNLRWVAEYGRYDDLLVLLETPCQKAVVELIRQQLQDDLQALKQGGELSLLGKWLPSINASNPLTVHRAKLLVKALGMDNKTYRQSLSRLRKALALLENHLRAKDYSFDYAKQPSKAMLKYRAAFFRNDEERYRAFLDQVEKGEAKLHTGTLVPYDIIAPLVESGCGFRYMTPEQRKSLNATWQALEDFTNDENALVVVDGSGSMYCGGKPLPAAVAISLGIYFAEHNKGKFHNHFITFSARPQLVEIKGKDIVDKVAYCESYDECANTNLAAVFRLLLDTAVKHGLPQEELPKHLYIITDMEFDYCAEDASLTNFQWAKAAFAEAGYQLPEVVFWNVNSRNQQQPVTANEQGVVLVSGNSPHVFQMVKKGLTPLGLMLETLNSERYAPISA